MINKFVLGFPRLYNEFYLEDFVYLYDFVGIGEKKTKKEY